MTAIATEWDVFVALGETLGIHPKIVERLVAVARAEPDKKLAHGRLRSALFAAVESKIPRGKEKRHV